MPETPSGPRAPYMDVLDALMEEIKGKSPGDPISSESELCERHGVARMTVRRAIGIARERGLIETRWGKGSFVAPPVGSGAEGDDQADA
ncbi:winged helix-turn-helix domain-containing protein [Streptomyces sp. NPDC006339]|uniref:winged helix-turn-helix domain-containing protein n=1 Tax=Streptomyces sp. NPDC006339 TaxID=3156755 RepID=UPI0033A7C37D